MTLSGMFINVHTSGLAKGSCYVCGSANRLVDMGVTIEGEGGLAICAVCVTEAAEAAELSFNEGVVRDLRVSLQSAENAALQAGIELNLAKAELTAAEARIEAAYLQLPVEAEA